MSVDERPLAKIRLHPAILVIGGLYATVFGRRFWIVSLEPPARTICWAIGVGLMVLGVLCLVLAYFEMARARTTINPRQHTTTVVTSGIYRFSRNPIYLGWFILTLGIGVATGSLCSIAMSMLMIGLLHRAVVLKEEAYLESSFGEGYLRYRESVRRWV